MPPFPTCGEEDNSFAEVTESACGFPKFRSFFGLHNKDYSILGSMSGSPHLGLLHELWKSAVKFWTTGISKSQKTNARIVVIFERPHLISEGMNLDNPV